MVVQKTKPELHDAMGATPTTDHWDVLVSYSSENLNKYLQESWNKRERLASPRIEVPGGHLGRRWTDIFELSLENPSLHFTSTALEATADLVLPVSGKTYDAKNPKESLEIPKGQFAYKVTVPIVSINGDGSEAPKSGNAIHFNDNGGDGKTKTFYISFHFRNEKSIWKLDDKHADDTSDEANALRNATEELRTYFQNANNGSIDYHIAEVSNAKHKDMSDTLTPTRFHLASQDGVLSVFINTKSNNMDTGKSNCQFQPKSGSDCTPIPKDYDASIIISREWFVNQYLIPGIEASGKKSHLTEVKDSGLGQEQQGLKLALKYDQQQVVSGSFPSTRSNLAYGSTDIDFDEHPVHLVISSDKELNCAQYQWEWKQDGTVHYQVYKQFDTPTGSHGFWQDYNTTYTGKIECEPRSLAKLGDNTVNFSLDFDKGNRPLVETKLSDLQVTCSLPELHLNLPELDYFRTTNVFCPGQKVIEVTACMVPFDFVLLGHVMVPK